MLLVSRQEPPYTEPYVRWCERTAGVTPPTRSCARHGALRVSATSLGCGGHAG